MTEDARTPTTHPEDVEERDTRSENVRTTQEAESLIEEESRRDIFERDILEENDDGERNVDEAEEILPEQEPRPKLYDPERLPDNLGWDEEGEITILPEEYREPIEFVVDTLYEEIGYHPDFEGIRDFPVQMAGRLKLAYKDEDEIVVRYEAGTPVPTLQRHDSSMAETVSDVQKQRLTGILTPLTEGGVYVDTSQESPYLVAEFHLPASDMDSLQTGAYQVAEKLEALEKELDISI